MRSYARPPRRIRSLYCMKVLGINQVPGMLAWTHDSAAALIVDGTLIATAEEERFNRQRHHKGYPYKAVEYCLSEGDIAKKDVDIVAVSFHPHRHFSAWPPNLNPVSFGRNLLNLGAFFLHRKTVRREFPNARVIYIPHHLAHAATAYRCSGFNEANILTIDGSGETETFAFYIGRGGVITKVWDIRLQERPWSRRKQNSIGFVYSKVTNFLNLGVKAEGKTMGLASYGTPRYDFSKILTIQNHTRYTINRENVGVLYPQLERKTAAEPLSQEQKDLAASVQAALEDSVVNLAREAHGYSGFRKFCLAGGVALNCNTNSRIAAEPFCDDIFVQPGANDGGAALGAALEAASLRDRPINFPMEHAYWGPSFSDTEVEKLLRNAKVRYERHAHIERETAKLLAQGKVVGWFQGRMELGPRALGNRSILADPTVKGMNDIVNNLVKHREPWRPFAPVVIEESGATYFAKYHKSPFMLRTFYVKPEFRERLPAITHIDGSSRIQTVTDAQNPTLCNLLREFEKRRGVPVLLNTSFNDKDEPIVCTPKDALRCFSSTGLDALVMGSFLVKKT